MFARSGNGWVTLPPLYPGMRQAGSRFGLAMAMDQGTLIVGAPGTNRTLASGNTAPANGRVHIFDIDPLTLWRQQRLGSVLNTGDAADPADPDADGAGNLVEYAFAMDPLRADSHLLPQPQRMGDKLLFRFAPPVPPVNLQVGMEASATLAPGSWRGLEDVSAVQGEHRFEFPIMGGRGFVRFKATLPAGP